MVKIKHGLVLKQGEIIKIQSDQQRLVEHMANLEATMLEKLDLQPSERVVTKEAVANKSAAGRPSIPIKDYIMSRVDRLEKLKKEAANKEISAKDRRMYRKQYYALRKRLSRRV